MLHGFQLMGAGVGVTFATTAQITKGLRGKVDEWNSFAGGAAVGALTAAQVFKFYQYILNSIAEMFYFFLVAT